MAGTLPWFRTLPGLVIGSNFVKASGTVSSPKHLREGQSRAQMQQEKG